MIILKRTLEKSIFFTKKFKKFRNKNFSEKVFFFSGKKLILLVEN